VLVVDLTTRDGLRRVEDRVADAGPLRMLVNNAGFGTRAFFVDLPPERTQAMIQLHVVAPVRLARAALPAMIEAGDGSVVNVSSLAAFMTGARYTTYSATKAYLNTFSLGLQAELRGTGVRVQALCPGLTRTGFMDTPDYAEFKYEQAPAWAWMSAEAVVDESIRALGTRKVVVIPGRVNRLFLRTMKTPLLGALTGKAIDALSD
jgi:short-subunit dehydrogenase